MHDVFSMESTLYCGEDKSKKIAVVVVTRSELHGNDESIAQGNKKTKRKRSVVEMRID